MTFMARLFLLFFVLCALPALAQEASPAPAAAEAVASAEPADPYTVSGIAIDMPVSDPQTARDQALAAAQKAGYQKLKEQLAVSGATLPEASDTQLNHLMRTFEVTGEKISARRYIGTYTIYWRSAAVQHVAGGSVSAETAATGAATSVAALYRFRQLQDWMETQRRLKQIPNVAGVDITAMGRSYLRLDVKYTGTREALMAALAAANLDLASTGELSLRGATL